MPEVAEVVDGVNDAPGAGIFDSIAIKEPVRSEPKLETGDQVEPEVEEAVEPEPEVKVEAKVEPEVKETPEPKTEEAKTYAGRFKKVEDLEVAYEQSSKEGKRLYDTVKEKESALEAKEAEIAELKAKLEEGPAPKELTEDELSQMSPHQVAQYFAEKTKREILGQQKKEKTEAQTKRQKQESEDTRRAILSDVEVMRKDKEKYPVFEDLQPVMKDIMDRFPAVTGYR